MCAGLRDRAGEAAAEGRVRQGWERAGRGLGEGGEEGWERACQEPFRGVSPRTLKTECGECSINGQRVQLKRCLCICSRCKLYTRGGEG